MKSLILTLSFLLFCLTNVVAQATSYGNWRFVSGDENLFLYSLDGSGVENFYEIPDFTIIIKKNKGGDMRIRLDNKVLYEYDDSENDANYVSVDIIVDNGEMLTYGGQIYGVNDDETRVYLSSNEGGPKLIDIIVEMQNGSELFVRTTGAKSPIVFKYSLSGFDSGFEKLLDSWKSCCKEIKNPFDSKNPFDQY